MNQHDSQKNLQYVAQSDISYTVVSPSGELVNIAKPYVQHKGYSQPNKFQDKLMHIAAIGLPLGGVLTVFLSPVVIWKNVTLLRKEQLDKASRIHAQNLIIISIILLILGIVFFTLFMMHLVL